jgi:hypothetical protein
MKNPVISSRFFCVGLIAFCLVATFSINTSGQKVRLRSQITPTCTSTQGASLKFADIFAEGNIAVQGSYGCKGVFIYDMTDPDAPVLASWYNPGNNQQFLEAIVLGDRGYFGSGTGGGGVHIVDLSNPYSPVFLGAVSSTVCAVGGTPCAYTTIHEMMVFDHAGARYLLENSNSTSNRPLRIIDVTNPTAPVFKHSFSSTDGGWVHAMHIRGNKLYLSGFVNSSRIDIYDITNLATQAPVHLGTIAVGGNSNHSAWTNETGEYLYSAREFSNAELRVYDVRNPQQPLLVKSFVASDLSLNAISPHNPVVMGNNLYVSWYQAGVQVFDITDPANPVRVGQYDTYQQEFVENEAESRSTDGSPWDIFCGSDPSGRALPSSYGGNWAVFPFLGANKVLAGDLRNGLLVLDASAISAPLKNRVSDFDGDGKTDLSVVTPATGNWRIETSSNGSLSDTSFGIAGDVITPGDYDGDGRSDLAIFRPSTATWWVRRSSDPTAFYATQFGVATDIPVAADYDADGRTDIAVWRPSTGDWWILQSTLGIRAARWGSNGDKPLTGDFEGDGKIDMAVWRPSTGVWYILQSSSSIPMYGYWGTNGDKPVSADFDGNGITDLTVYRPSEGMWYIRDPATGAFTAYHWGVAEDMPIPADFDGDAKADLTVFRPSNNTWYRINSSNGAMDFRVFGQTGDRPSPSSVQPQ